MAATVVLYGAGIVYELTPPPGVLSYIPESSRVELARTGVEERNEPIWSGFETSSNCPSYEITACKNGSNPTMIMLVSAPRVTICLCES